ncbi:hypothetical protein ABKV19_017656 [Rosa sericea]
MSIGAIETFEGVPFGGNLNQKGPAKRIYDPMPKPVFRNRIEKLRLLQFEHDTLERQYFKDRAALEAEFQQSCLPLHNQMCDIVNTVPYFWLKALTNNKVLRAKITEHDERALKFLRDIKWSKTDSQRGFGFKLEFFFDSNPFFRNPVLTKTYDMIDEDLPILRKAIGTEVEWYSRTRLTPNLNEKRLNEGTNNWGSFFNFFSPPQVPKVIDGKAAKEIQNLMEQDYEIGSAIREVIPHAVSWFAKNGPTSATSLLGSSPIRITNLASGGVLNDQAVLDKMQILDGQDSVILGGLGNIQRKLDKLEEEFFKKREALRAKYEELYEALYNKRCSIVNGDAGLEGDSDEAATKQEPATCKCTCVKAVTEPDLVAFIRSRANGVPGFWLHALSKNNLLTREIIGRDTEALAYLRDIKGSKIDGDNKGFKLDFYFEPNNFFMNPVLTKTYHMVDEVVPILAKAIGTEIEWYPGRCLTKNPIKKNSKKGSFPKGTEYRKSFFNFFSTPQVLEDIDAVRNQMKIDYEIGSTIRDMIIPYAVSWFTGEAWRSRDEYSDTEDDDDEDDDDE